MVSEEETEQGDEELELQMNALRLNSEITLLFNFMGLDYVRFYKAFLALEEEFSPLPLFHIPEYFPPLQSKEILKFRIKEQTDIKRLFTEIKNLFTASPHNNFPPGNLVGLFIKKVLKSDFKNQVETYLSYFEHIYENFVIPLIEKGSKTQITGHNNQIAFVRQLLEGDPSNPHPYSELNLFLRKTDGTLRNALVHKNYYIKDQCLHYFQAYPRRKEVRFQKMSLKDFDKLVGDIFFRRWIFNIMVGFRLGKISLERVKELSDEKIIYHTKSKNQDSS